VEHNLGEISTCDNKTKKHNRKITKAKKNKQKQPKEPKKGRVISWSARNVG
jgi:hypothetical protein